MQDKKRVTPLPRVGKQRAAEASERGKKKKDNPRVKTEEEARAKAGADPRGDATQVGATTTSKTAQTLHCQLCHLPLAFAISGKSRNGKF